MAKPLELKTGSNAESFSTESIITDHIDIWTSAIEQKSSAGRGTSNKFSLYGIKKLRELILELAVRGQLVPQDPNDEPASVLLERIAVEKAQLVKEGKLKKQKPLTEISEDEKPFELPVGWCFVRLGNITARLGSGSTPRGGQSAYVENGIPFLRSQNVWNDGLKLDDIAFITPDTHEAMSNTKVFENDVLLNITGASLGRTTVFPKGIGEANVNQHVTVIRLIKFEMCEFIHLGLMSPMVQKLVWGRQVGMAIEGLSKKVLEQFEFPIPPLEEQHRIVAKVDELMLLCDALETQTEASIAAHQTLVETLLNALLLPNTTQQATTNTSNTLADSPEPSLANSFEMAWLRIAEHFDTLFTTAASIDTLKQTILQLAVMGKLVPQASCEAKNSSNYEPAAKLLERIAKEKAQLIKDGKIKKQKPLPAITDEEKPYELPQGWEWENLNSLITIMDAGWSPACPPEASPNNDVWGVLKTTAVQNMEYREYENKVLSESKEPRPQYEVKVGDILITRAGPKNRVGVSCLVQKTRPKLMISDKIIRFHLIEVDMSNRYISLCLNAGPTAEFLESTKSGMAESQMNISQDKLKAAPIPLAPIEEQHRIVAKVDELMTICDQLKARLSEAQTTQLHLTDAIVEQAV
ncbi:restriction endonuclease subunit S [Shewanella algicola]|uniref:restriction endonuclease subunit S n=1 Tax=Shewanella algicola TaxID=640633 RepID=UPI002494D260|nr:restriction endonuclease subunit S [Shewanella algicola]